MTFILFLLFTHWIADFVLQTDKMAKNKSTSWVWLGLHSIAYAVTFFFMLYLFTYLPLQNIFFYIIINGVAHFVVDAVTSRINSKLWGKGKVHYFFVSVGFDQFIHFATLLLTLKLL